MSLHKDIRDQIKDAMKAKDTLRLTVIRGLVTAFTNELVAKSRKPDGELTDEEALAVIKRAVKQRKDSIEQFTKGGREDLAQNEKDELVILEKYLPAMMGSEEIKKIVSAKKAELGVTDKKDIGKLMAAVMKETKGKADGGEVKAIVDSSF
jgi:uncharacterized protein YqeY